MSNSIKYSKSGKKLDKAEDVADLVEEIKNKEDSLETLTLEGNSYGVETLKEIGSALEMCNSLKHLMFNDMFISRLKTEIPQGLQFLFGGIMASQAHIITLNLNDNAIGPVTMPALIPFLKSLHCSSLKVLRLNNCGLGIKGGNMLASVLGNLENLNELVIGRNRLEIDGVRDISNALAKLNKLEKLELPQNGTKAEGITSLCNALQANPNIKVLNLNDNVLKNNATEFASVLKNLKYIEVLNLGDCLLTTKGCMAIMNSLKSLCEENNVCYLQQLILNGNEIGKEASNCLINTLEKIIASKKDGTRLKVDLSANNFGSEIVDQLNEQFYQLIDLIIEDDEGSGDEHEDNENDQSKDSIQQDNEELDVETLAAKFQTQFPDLNSLCAKFSATALKGFNPEDGSLNKKCLIEIEAIIKVGLSKTNSDDDFEFVNNLLVHCGLLKSENKKSKAIQIEDFSGPLVALANTMKHFKFEQKKCLKLFILKKLEEPKYSNIKLSLMSNLYSF